MQNLPLEVFCKVINYLELPDLRNSIRVNSKWRLIVSGELQKRPNIWIAFEREDQLTAFNHQFSVKEHLPTYRFHFGEGVLSEVSFRQLIQEFAEKFGNIVRAYSFNTEYWEPGGGDREMMKCIQDNIGLLLNYSLEHLVELTVTTNYELGPIGLPGNFPELRIVAIKYNMKQFEHYDRTFISELSGKVPKISAFGVHSDITGANMDKQFVQKLPKILQNLARMNNSVKVQLTFRIYSSDISTFQHLVTLSIPNVSEVCIMLMTSTISVDTNNRWKWTTTGYKGCYNAISKLLTANAHCLKKLTLKDTNRRADSQREEDDIQPKFDLKLPKLVALKELNIKSFHTYTSIGLRPFHANHFENLKTFNLNVESILCFPESKWEGIKHLYLYAAKDEPINSKISERLPIIFPNVEFLGIHAKLILIQLALKLPQLIKLEILQGDYEEELDYWKILTGMEGKVTLAEMCNVLCNQGRMKHVAANQEAVLHDYQNLKRLQRLEIESESSEVAGALIFMSMIGKLGRLKELLLRFRDETTFPEMQFVEELRLHHDSVKIGKSRPLPFPQSMFRRTRQMRLNQN